MLVLDHVAPEATPAIVIDPYVPLSIEVPNGSDLLESVVYWRVKHAPSTLIEVGVAIPSGRLRSVCVTALESQCVSAVTGSPTAPVASEERGVPCFDTRAWILSQDFESRFLDLDLQPTVQIGAGTCAIAFDKRAGAHAASAVRLGPARFLFARDRSWVGLEIGGISDDDARTVMSSVGA